MPPDRACEWRAELQVPLPYSQTCEVLAHIFYFRRGLLQDDVVCPPVGAMYAEWLQQPRALVSFYLVLRGPSQGWRLDSAANRTEYSRTLHRHPALPSSTHRCWSRQLAGPSASLAQPQASQPGGLDLVSARESFALKGFAVEPRREAVPMSNSSRPQVRPFVAASEPPAFPPAAGDAAPWQGRPEALLISGVTSGVAVLSRRERTISVVESWHSVHATWRSSGRIFRSTDYSMLAAPYRCPWDLLEQGAASP
eukprot:scaffold292072_cov27-Tisochrysis_lutea.AAC.1